MNFISDRLLHVVRVLVFGFGFWFDQVLAGSLSGSKAVLAAVRALHNVLGGVVDPVRGWGVGCRLGGVNNKMAVMNLCLGFRTVKLFIIVKMVKSGRSTLILWNSMGGEGEWDGDQGAGGLGLVGSACGLFDRAWH